MKLSLNKKIIVGLLMLILLATAIIVPKFAISSEVASASTDLSEKRYGRDDVQIISTYAIETINYTKREADYYETTNGVPLYEAYLADACGATAGAIIVGFYDKYYEELIPGYTGYYPATGKYKRMDKVYVPQLTESLYTLMRTNVDDVGVSESDCLNGLRLYVQNKNHSITYSSVKSSSSINTTAYLNSINANKPVIIFSGSVSIQDFNTQSTYEQVSNYSITDNHVFVGYGYYVIRYYNGNSVFRTDTYLRVACGRTDYTDGFIRVASTSGTVQSGWIHNAYTVAVT